MLATLIGQIRSLSAAVLEDREMDADIERIATTIAESDPFEGKYENP